MFCNLTTYSISTHACCVPYSVVDASFEIGDVDAELKGHGQIQSTCEVMGDLLVTVDVWLTNIPVRWCK
jgi:hypothetical protein